MTLASESSSAVFVGNGTATIYPISFLFYDSAHLVVTINGVTKTEGAHYAVFGAGAGDGEVWFTTAPAVDAAIVISRNVPLLQQTDLSTQGTVLPESIEKQFDLDVMMAQEVRRTTTALAAAVATAQTQVASAAATATAAAATAATFDGRVTTAQTDATTGIAAAAAAATAAANAATAAVAAATATHTAVAAGYVTGWESHPSYPAGYTRAADGRIELYGAARRPSAGDIFVHTTFLPNTPQNCRPATNKPFLVQVVNGGGIQVGTLTVGSDGSLTVDALSPNFFASSVVAYLNGVSFYPVGS